LRREALQRLADRRLQRFDRGSRFIFWASSESTVNLGLGADFDERRLFLTVISDGRRRLAIWISVTPKWLWRIS
jgi:hypothetical protein